MKYYVKTIIICLFLICNSPFLISEVIFCFEDSLAPLTEVNKNPLPLSLTDSFIKRHTAEALIEFININSKNLNSLNIEDFYSFVNINYPQVFNFLVDEEEKKFDFYLTVYSFGVIGEHIQRYLQKDDKIDLSQEIQDFLTRIIKDCNNQLNNSYVDIQDNFKRYRSFVIIEYFKDAYQKYLKDSGYIYEDEDPFFKNFFEFIIYPERRKFIVQGEFIYFQKLQTLSIDELNSEWRRQRRLSNDPEMEYNILQTLSIDEFMGDTRQYAHEAILSQFAMLLDEEDTFFKKNLASVLKLKNIFLEWVRRHWEPVLVPLIRYKDVNYSENSDIITGYFKQENHKKAIEKMLPLLDQQFKNAVISLNLKNKGNKINIIDKFSKSS